MAEPVAWMRRWAFDRVDVMRLPKAERPRGWAMHDVTRGKLFDDDVPLYAAADAARPLPADTVKMPETADEAALMALLGERWLREHAPERLTARQSIARTALAQITGEARDAD